MSMVKILMSNTSGYLTYDQNTEDWVVVSTSKPSLLDFTSQGMSDEEIKAIPNWAWGTLGDSAELLYYTDDESISEANVSLEINWSPIDELNGDFEVVSWADDGVEALNLELTATPSPKLTYALEVTNTNDSIDSIITEDVSVYYKESKVRYLITPDNSNWYTFSNDEFVKLNNITNDTVESEGMTYDIVSNLSSDDFLKWNHSTLNIGVYLVDDKTDTIKSKVSNLGIKTTEDVGTSSVSEASFYILNTTATINVNFSGLTLTGSVSDDDTTRVQYKVLLNDEPYYPKDGNFTALSSPPNNIDITLSSEDIDIDKWNTIEVVFKDYFGTEDSWSEQFIGKYASLMFSDESGEYYSTDMGIVLKYLDFGQILTGRTTPVYKVNLKNQYGYDVTDVALTADTNDFPTGLEVQFSLNDEFINARNFIQFGDLAVDEEKPFYIRMYSPLSTEPNGSNTFDIYVSAKREV